MDSKRLFLLIIYPCLQKEKKVELSAEPKTNISKIFLRNWFKIPDDYKIIKNFEPIPVG
jgi:hypothetical protein